MTILLDPEDQHLLASRRWFTSSKGYAVANGPGRGVLTMLHRVVVQAPADMHVDHINGNRLDNRKSNLRIVTRSQNMWNSKKPRNNTSGVKGLSWSSKSKSWVAYVGKIRRRFKDKDTAVEWLRQTREEIHAEFARHE